MPRKRARGVSPTPQSANKAKKAKRARTKNSAAETNANSKYYSGWKQQPAKTAVPVLIDLDKVPESLGYSERVKTHVDSMYDKIGNYFNKEKTSADEKLTEVKLVSMLLRDGFRHIFKQMNVRFTLAELFKEKVREDEFGQFIAMLLWIMNGSWSVEQSLSDLRDIMAFKMDIRSGYLTNDRFTKLLKFFTGADNGLATTTSTLHIDASRGPEKFEKLSEELFKEVAVVALDNCITVTIDDRIIKFRGIGNLKIAINPDKRNNFGVGRDDACCATFRIKLTGELYQANVSQLDRVEEILKRIKGIMDKNKFPTTGVKIVVDRGYPSIGLIKVVARHGMEIFCICREDLRQGHPMMAKSAVERRISLAKKSNRQTILSQMNEKNIIDDGPKLGPACVVHKKSFTRLAGKGAPKLDGFAYTVREDGDDNKSKILRFLHIGGTNKEDIYQNHYVLKPHIKVPTKDQKKWLFYPSANEDGDKDETNAQDGDEDADDEAVTFNNEGEDIAEIEAVYREEDRGADVPVDDEPDDADDADDADAQGGTEENGAQSAAEDSEASDSEGGAADEAQVTDKVADAEEDDDVNLNEVVHKFQQQENSLEGMVDIDATEILNWYGARENDEEIPGVKLEKPREEIEAILEKNITPLTAGQRTLQWFLFRRGLVTGTTAQTIAKHDRSVKALLFSNPERSKTTDLTDAKLQDLLINSWFFSSGKKDTNAYAMKVGTDNEKGVVDQLRKKKFVSEIFEIGLVQNKEKYWLGVSADNIVVLVPPKKENKVENRIVASLEIKTKVSRKQLHRSYKIRDEFLREAKANDDPVDREGNYVYCKMGSQLWFALVPTEYRGQVLHQASVLGLTHAAFCIATRTDIIYTVLVYIPEDNLTTWKNSLDAVESFAKPLWDRVSELLGTQSNKNVDRKFRIAANSKWNSENRAILVSWFPMWFAFHKRRLQQQSGVMPPYRSMRSLIQLDYSRYKQGVDGVDDIAEKFASRALRMNYEQKVTSRLVIDAIISVAGLWRIFKVKSSDNFEWRGLKPFRRQLINKCRYMDFTRTLIFELLKNPLMLLGSANHDSPPHDAQPQPPASECQPPKTMQQIKEPTEAEYKWLITEYIWDEKKPKQRKPNIGLDNSALYQANIKKLRCAPVQHKRAPKTNPKIHGQSCVMCSANCENGCEYCQIPLCGRLKKNNKSTCWDKWHNHQVIGVRPKKTIKKPKKASSSSSSQGAL